MPELNKISEAPPPSGDDSLAKKEQESLYTVKRKKRKDQVRGNLHILFLVALWTLSLLGLGCALILTIHYAAPPCWRWLADSDLERLRTNLGSVFIGAILSRWLEHKFKQEDGDSEK